MGRIGVDGAGGPRPDRGRVGGAEGRDGAARGAARGDRRPLASGDPRRSPPPRAGRRLGFRPDETRRALRDLAGGGGGPVRRSGRASTRRLSSWRGEPSPTRVTVAEATPSRGEIVGRRPRTNCGRWAAESDPERRFGHRLDGPQRFWEVNAALDLGRCPTCVAGQHHHRRSGTTFVDPGAASGCGRPGSAAAGRPALPDVGGRRTRTSRPGRPGEVGVGRRAVRAVGSGCRCDRPPARSLGGATAGARPVDSAVQPTSAAPPRRADSWIWTIPPSLD